jgi:hypothetical protein
MTGSFDTASYRQRVRHFTETLDFLSEEDKDWVMGRAIMARLSGRKRVGPGSACHYRNTLPTTKILCALLSGARPGRRKTIKDRE